MRSATCEVGTQTVLSDVPDDVLAAGIVAVRRYLDAIERGESPRLAEMLALQSAPRCLTDSVVFAGLSNSQFEKNPAMGELYARRLRALGGSTTGKIYMHQLAEDVGDPEAWVASTGEARALCRKRGYESEALNVRRNRDCRENGFDKSQMGVADDIVDSEVNYLVKKNPEIAPTPRERAELREQIKEKRSPQPRARVASAGSKARADFKRRVRNVRVHQAPTRIRELA